MRSKRGFIFGFFSVLLLLFLAAVQLLSYLSVVINPARAWFFTLFGLAFVPVSLLNLIILISLLIRRRWGRALIPLLALLPALLLLGRFFPLGKDLPTDGPALRIVSYNVNRFLPREGLDSREAVADSVWSFIRRQDADIVCLQEFHIRDARRVQQTLGALMPGYQAGYFLFPTRMGSYGNVVFSRFPITGKGVLHFEGSANLAIYADCLIAGREVRVYNCHFESYNISPSRLAHAFDEGEEGLLQETEDKMKRSITRRPRQVEAVMEDIDKCPLPSFVCGDFNDSPMSYTYQRLSRGRKDAFSAGHGPGGTFPAFLIPLRIDYVLAPPPFEPLSYEAPRMAASDHLPVVTSFRFSEK